MQAVWTNARNDMVLTKEYIYIPDCIRTWVLNSVLNDCTSWYRTE